MKRILALVMVTLTALFVISCGSTTNAPTATSVPANTAVKAVDTPVAKETPKSTNPTAGETPKPAATAVATAAAKETPKAGATSTASGDPMDFLKNIVSTKDKGSFKVAYQIYGKDQTTGKDTVQKMVYYRKGDQKRLDTEADVLGTTPGGRLYMKGDEAVSCEQSGGTWTCTKLTGELGKMTAQLATVFIDSADEFLGEVVKQAESGGVKPDSVTSGKIAGQDAKIYIFKAPPPEKGVLEFAYTNDGILLRMSLRETGDASTDMKIEATEFTKQVSDSDFKPPAEPIG